MKDETKSHDETISDKFYEDYSKFKQNIFTNLVENNPQIDKLTLFKKSQKFLDRLLFIFFAEDTGLVPPNAINRIIDNWKKLRELDEDKPLYGLLKKFFTHLDKGFKYKSGYELPAYNGGLFASDEILDNVIIDDEILLNDSLKLSTYDFNTDVDVNILGHIFEHSLNEIEELEKEYLSISLSTRGHDPLSKRKKDGIFYTPKYITQYIVENTIGTLCTEKRKELNIIEIEFDETYRKKDLTLSSKGQKLFNDLQTYKEWLLTLKILDPACGSGAFLNQALSFLIQEHKNIDDIISELTNQPLRLFDTDKAILENNLFGVDINEESVEIAQLSLWLRTAQKGRKLSNLTGNIKCGNSLIDDPIIAGDKAFEWNKEFPQIFKEKTKKAWHITTATHDSRTSQRMIDYKVRQLRNNGLNPKAQPICLNLEDELLITKVVARIVKEDNLNILAYNICGEHLHILLVCEEEELSKIVGKIKSITAKEYNISTRGHDPLADRAGEKNYNISTRGHDPLPETAREKNYYQPLWTQKFGSKEITSNEQIWNTVEYI